MCKTEDYSTNNFVLGDEWIYMKIYSGVQMADYLLINDIIKLKNTFENNEYIEKWFFIRYSFPKNHLRVRFKLKDINYLIYLIRDINKTFSSYLNNDVIWDIEFCTYKREIERYGIYTMDLSESIFQIDSEVVVKSISLFQSDDTIHLRWMFGLVFMNEYINSICDSIMVKIEFVDNMKRYYLAEFGNNKNLTIQFDKKYRQEYKNIELILNENSFLNLSMNDSNVELYRELNDCIIQSSMKLKKIINEIGVVISNNNSEVSLSILTSSYIHMMVNRLFRNEQRLIEFELYYFLDKYYNSLLVRK